MTSGCDQDCQGCPWPRTVAMALPPPAEGGAPLPLIGCGARPPGAGEWVRCSPWPLADGALLGRPTRLAVLLGEADGDAATARLDELVSDGTIAGAELIVPAQTLRALAEHNPAWTGRQGALRVLGVSRAAGPWGGVWDLERLVVYDGSSGRQVNEFDGAGFAVVDLRVARASEAVGPDEPVVAPAGPRPPLPFVDVLRWEGGRTQVILRLTSSCNQRCPHCLVSPFDVPTAQDLDAALALADETLACSGRATLVLSGGEPLLSPELDRVIRWAGQRSSVRVSLQTNAALIPCRGAMLDALVDAGLWDVLVNLPSFDEETYRRMTGGTDLLGDALCGVDRLVERGLEVNLNLVLTRLNASQVTDYVHQVSRRWGSGARVTLSTLSPATPRSELVANAVPHSEARAVLQCALDAARDGGVEVVIAGGDCAPPACLIPAELAMGETVFQRVDEEIRVLDDRPLSEGVRYKVVGCAACRFDDRCPGVAAAHVAAFGVDGLIPVP